MDEFNSKNTKIISSKLNILILLFLILFAIIYFIQTKFTNKIQNNDSINFPSCSELEKNITISLADMIEKNNKTDSKTDLKQDQYVSVNYDQAKIYSYIQFLRNIEFAKNLIYANDNYTEYLDRYNDTEDQKIVAYINDIKIHANKNISIINLIEIINKADFLTENKNLQTTSDIVYNLTSYISNVIKVKKIDSKKSDNIIIVEDLKTHLINREFKLALQIIENIKIENSEINILKEKISSFLLLEDSFNNLVTYISSKNFIESYLHSGKLN